MGMVLIKVKQLMDIKLPSAQFIMTSYLSFGLVYILFEWS